MTDATVGFLLENLKQLLLYNADLIEGVEDNVKELCEALDTLRAFIIEYTRKQHNNEILKALVKEIRNVVNEAEDAIETFLVQASIHENRSFIKKAVHMFDYPYKLRNVAKEIQAVREKVKHIYQNKAAFGLEVLQSDDDSGRGAHKKLISTVEEDNVIGLDDEVKNVIELLTGESEELQVISIIGMSGLGKTTLAKKILHDPKIEYEFNPRIFINVSQEYKRRDVFFSLLGALTQITPEMNLMSDNMLAEAIRINLKAKKYLTVVDDVWTRDAWDDLKIAFPNNSKSSRLLITSRHIYVARHANPTVQPHDKESLTLDASRELLRRRVFGSENSCPPDLEEYELHIAQRCGGVPQAIISIAGILLNKRDRTSWWKKVSESVSDYFSRNEGQGDDVVTLSYNHLPFHLKPCFLYLGVFLEDFEIPVWKLLRLWIAEGLIRPEGNVSLEDLAEEYLEELVDRDLVMVGQRKSDGKIKTCRIRNTLREFCKKEALEENLFHEIKRFDSYAISNPSADNYRRLCINSNFSEYIHSKPSGAHVRSLLSFTKEEIVLDPEHISSIPEAFSLLRVLDIKSVNFTSFPEKLCGLVLLKYLAISGDFDMLPASISRMWNMQTIIIETSARSIRVEADIWKLFLLRHFHTKASANLICPPPKTHTGKEIRANLHTLSTISPESCQKDMFDRTPRLKKLGVCGKLAKLMEGNGECSLFDSLCKLEYLENLKLINDDTYSKLYGLPHEYNFPSKLAKLTLTNTMLDWKHISTLGKLENLEVLKLKENAFLGEWWQTEDGGFKRLKVLHIGKTDLVVWKASAHHFPILKSLILRNCTMLQAVPSRLAEIPSLQTLELFSTNPSVASSARKIQILKLQIEAQEGIKGNGFKLSIYPPDQ